MKDTKWENMPQKIEWQEEIEFFPIYINRKTFTKIKRMDLEMITDFCIKAIRDKVNYSVFSIDRELLVEQVETMFAIMSDKAMCYNTCLLLVPLNHISEMV
ncbi:MAG TPA: hypothetical protein PK718_01890 [Candidatus Methanofastidiosa archaeon]|nr:hypothetical protein [Candidatus Methanofastidiosa archaeon]HPR41282.1 hypothetical protein [Candidatus Methanofastidiosa archaeon]